MNGKLNFVRNLRVFIVITLYRLMRLDVDYWRQEVVRLWALSPEDYRRSLDSIINEIKPIDGAGNRIHHLDDISYAKPVSKKILNNRSAQRKYSKFQISRYTSGTTGTRTKVFLTKSELGRLLAVRDYCLRAYGIRLGEREVRLWGTKHQTISNRIKDWILHRKSFYIHGGNLGDVSNEILEFGPDYIFGYSSYIIVLARYLLDQDIKIPTVKLVICTAEQILPIQKQFISRAFGSRVVEEYGSTEFDVVAFEDENGDLRLVNPWLLVECHKDNILITDVYRSSQSFVRYTIGDLGAIKNKSSQGMGGRGVLGELNGRNVNQYAYGVDRTEFHAAEFSKALNRYFNNNNDLFDFIVIQKQWGKFEIQLSAEPKIGLDPFCEWLSNYISKQADTIISVSIGGVGSLREFRNKRSYFIQNIKSDSVG